MASSSSNTNVNSNLNLSEKDWVFRTQQVLQNKILSDQNIPISVCQVPKSISVVKPQAYAPQMIALGPYHYSRPELYHMERSKINVVISYWNPDQIDLVIEKLKSIGPIIRACYHKYLELEDDTLALMLAIDVLFFIFLLRKDLNGFASDASIFSDVMMLENQIPMIILKEIVNIDTKSSNDNDLKLLSLMWEFCESNSPFVLPSKQQDIQEWNVLHLLDLLHKMITLPQRLADDSAKKPVSPPREVQVELTPASPPREVQVELSPQASPSVKIDLTNDQLVQNFIGIAKTDIINSIRPIRFITSLPWGMISRLVSQSLGLQENATNNSLVEEIEIPSVSELTKMAGISFKPLKDGTVKPFFDSKITTLYLPVITLTANSEVILRNLEAYEMASSSNATYESQVIAQYLDLMCGILDTKKDASLLRQVGIIKGDLTDTLVADLFNGINKSSTKIYKDTTAAKINDYYRQKLKVKVYKFTKKYVYESWQVLTVVSTLVLLLLLILQSFCSVYDCKHVTRW
ncbi:hypothetical protein CTI12_AA392100 [Artemisia annua]|uniref:Uncharacterized protein n=1 Tax=Artemisia annua TaxID=35608 RepID=A0A2U1MDK9_ARTAN|nr:hypothetical protein CTI12_AA392100 [Artemisia annua]